MMETQPKETPCTKEDGREQLRLKASRELLKKAEAKLAKAEVGNDQSKISRAREEFESAKATFEKYVAEADRANKQAKPQWLLEFAEGELSFDEALTAAMADGMSDPEARKALQEAPTAKSKASLEFLIRDLPRGRERIYFYPETGNYYVEDAKGKWIKTSSSDVEDELRTMGFNDRRFSAGVLSQLKEEKRRIRRENNVDYVGPVAGYPAGWMEQDELTVLVTGSTKLIEPVKGEFPIINHILNELLRDKRKYFDAYCKTTHEGLELCLKTKESTYGPVVIFAGPKNCGKSLVAATILTPLLGGKSEDPFQYFVGETPFNAELTGAGHLVLEDSSSAKDIATRRRLGQEIKKYAANVKKKSHGKNKDGISLKPFQRLSVSVNDEPEDLETLPPMVDSLLDKILLFRCYPVALPMPAETPQEKFALAIAIAKEMPAYVYYLRHEFQIPEDIKVKQKGMRYGFNVFQDPVILERIEGTSPESQLLEMLEQTYLRKGAFVPKSETKPQWIGMGSASQVFCTLTDGDYNPLRSAAIKLLMSPKKCGDYLSRLVERYPKRIKKYTGHGNITKYRIYFDPTVAKERSYGGFTTAGEIYTQGKEQDQLPRCTNYERPDGN
jgi:hypothetical protein